MEDRVFIRHPAYPDRNGYVSQRAFDNLWSKKGYVLDVDSSDLRPAVEAVYGDAAWTDPDRLVEDAEPADSPPAETPEVDEVAHMQGRLAAHGVKVDKRWGLKRLRSEVAALEDTE